jgi:Zn-dependent protease with chaperone function
MRRAVALLLTLGILVGCATPRRRFPTRPPSDSEMRLLTEAVRPLLYELDYRPPRTADDCRVALVILVSQTINAGAGPGKTTPCLYFTLGVTEPALRRLSVPMLRAMLAHELGHVQLGHFEARKAEGGPAIVLRRLTYAFDRAQEDDADRFAIQLLRKLEVTHPGACLALVHVLALLAEQPQGQAAWLSSHPSPERRAERARSGCQRSESSNF